MKDLKQRRSREKRTFDAMILLWCRGNHGTKEGLCQECRALMEYTRTKLERCPFGEDKPTCANCPVHCFQIDQREAVRKIMRYAGPRMLWHHPVLTLCHMMQERREAPAKKSRTRVEGKRSV
jgi:predicted amidophosphoribosyltransferase